MEAADDPANCSGPNIGLAASGGFRTSHLKVYQPSMCKAMAMSLLDALQVHHAKTKAAARDAADLPGDFVTMCDSMVVPFDDYGGGGGQSTTMQADCHGGNNKGKRMKQRKLNLTCLTSTVDDMIRAHTINA